MVNKSVIERLMIYHIYEYVNEQNNEKALFLYIDIQANYLTGIILNHHHNIIKFEIVLLINCVVIVFCHYEKHL